MRKYDVQDAPLTTGPDCPPYGPSPTFTYHETLILLRIINRYLADHPDGESAREAERLRAKLRIAIEMKG